MMAPAASQIDEEGSVVASEALGPVEMRTIEAAIGVLTDRVSAHGRGGARRIFEEVPEVRTLARHPAVHGVAAAALGPACFPVRAVLFDKTPSANWKVAWHQDLTIAVRARRDVDGYGPWSSKAGVPHVQPPLFVLEHMLAVRVHLDDCGRGNGPLRVLPGSHRAGRIPSTEIQAWRRRVAEVTCVVPRGGLLVMRPLLLHASSPAKSPAHRRVIHIEYAATDLAGGLEWYQARMDGVVRP